MTTTSWSLMPGDAGNLDAGPYGEPAAVTLKHDGSICDCNEAAEALFGFRREELVTHSISRLLPELAQVEWVQERRPNPQLSFLCRIGKQFEALVRDGGSFPCRIALVDLGNHIQCRLRLVVRRVESVALAARDESVPC